MSYLIKNKLGSLFFVALGIISIPVLDGDASFFVFSLLIAVPMFFSNEPWFYSDIDN